VTATRALGLMIGLAIAELGSAACRPGNESSNASSTAPTAASPCNANVGLNRDVVAYNGTAYTDGATGQFVQAAGLCTPVVRSFQNENATFIRVDNYDPASGVRNFGLYLTVLATGAATGTFTYDPESSLAPIAINPTGDMSSPAQLCATSPLSAGSITLTRNAASTGQPIQGTFSFSNLLSYYGAACPATVTGTFEVTRE